MKLAVRVRPGARRAGVVGRLADGTWKLAVTAPPEGGRANEAVCELVAAALGLRARQVQVARGAASRSKVLEIEGVEVATAEARLAAAAKGSGDGE